MRLIQMCLPLVLGPLIGAAQQAQPSVTQKPAQTPAAKQSSAAVTGHKTSHRAARRRHAARKGAKRRAYRPEYADNTVEVINGSSTNKVVFHNEPAAKASNKKLPAALKDVPQPMKVEVVNGNSTDTQYFYGNGQETAIRNASVVVGIQSSDTRTVGGNKRPVVTNVNSAGSGDAKSTDSGGQPVTKDVSPHPKRPVYQPDER